MSALQEQAVRMIGRLSDDNVGFLIDLMRRFMIPEEAGAESAELRNAEDIRNVLQEMEIMRKHAREYFSVNFDPEKVWKEAMDEKYGSFT